MTLRQLWWAYEGRQLAEWDRAAMVAGAILRTMGDFQGGLAQLNPYRKESQRKKYMPVAALYARRAAIAKRNAERADAAIVSLVGS